MSISERQIYNLPKCLLGVLGYRAPQSPVLGGILGNVVFWLNMATRVEKRKRNETKRNKIKSFISHKACVSVSLLAGWQARLPQW